MDSKEFVEKYKIKCFDKLIAMMRETNRCEEYILEELAIMSEQLRIFNSIEKG